jgi:hypothetical protein
MDESSFQGGSKLVSEFEYYIKSLDNCRPTDLDKQKEASDSLNLTNGIIIAWLGR